MAVSERLPIPYSCPGDTRNTALCAEPEFFRRRNGLTTHPPDNACEKTTTCCCKELRRFLLFHLEFNDKSVELPKRLPKEEMNRQTQQPAETRKRKNRPQLRRNRPVCSTRNSWQITLCNINYRFQLTL